MEILVGGVSLWWSKEPALRAFASTVGLALGVATAAGGCLLSQPNSPAQASLTKCT